jgi:4-hydroxybenzoyl-CoA thioesterase
MAGASADRVVKELTETGRPRLTPLSAAALPVAAFRARRTIRFSDCDPAGIAYTPRLIDLMNGVIEDLFPARLGLDYHALIRDRRLGLGYARVDTDFLRPVSMGDDLVFTAVLDRIGSSSAAWRMHVHRGEVEAARAQLVMVTTALDRRVAIPLPDDLRGAMITYRDQCL